MDNSSEQSLHRRSFQLSPTNYQFENPDENENNHFRVIPKRAKTQYDQDKDDEKARQKAQQQLVQSWMDRLQLVTVVTTFFAANETQLLSITTPPDSPNSADKILQASNALLTSSLVLHSFSAVIAFVGAFILVTYKLKEEKREGASDLDKEEQKRHAPSSPNAMGNRIWSTNPRLEQVGSVRQGEPPTILLRHAHNIAILTGFVGFIFAMAGIMCYVWAQQSRFVCIFSSATLGACLLVSLTVINPLKQAEEVI